MVNSIKVSTTVDVALFDVLFPEFRDSRHRWNTILVLLSMFSFNAYEAAAFSMLSSLFPTFSLELDTSSAASS